MFDLEKAIAGWREEMQRAGMKRPDILNELETHLREQVAIQVRSGVPEVAAFASAVSRLGTPHSIVHEFNKLKRTRNAPWPLFAGAVTVLLLLMAALFNAGSGHSSPLFAAHALCLTAGYVTVFLSGAIGICFVGQRILPIATHADENSLSRTVFKLNCFAAVLVGAGLCFGILWTKQSWNKYFIADLRAIGTFCVALWLIVNVLVQRRLSANANLLMAIAGSLILTFAWFGAGIISSNLHNYGWNNLWPYEVFASAHVVALAFGCFPVNGQRLKIS